MQSKYVLVALLIGANLLGYSFITPDELRRFDWQFFHLANLLLVGGTVFVSVLVRKLTMLWLKIPEQGLWLPAILCIGDTVMCAVAILLAAYLAPGVFTFPHTSVFHLFMFWFGVGTFVVILKIVSGDLPVNSQDV